MQIFQGGGSLHAQSDNHSSRTLFKVDADGHMAWKVKVPEQNLAGVSE